MMNLAIILAFLTAVVLPPAFAGRRLYQTSTTFCQVFGSVSVVVEPGSCKGWAGASCSSLAFAESKLESEVKEILTNDLCSPASAEAAATAAATVYFDALAKVSCDGQAFGCGFSVTRGDSFATAYAEAFVRAVAFAAAGDSSVVCMEDFTAITVGFAQAVADGSARACVEDSGSAEAFRSGFVLSATTAIAEALTIATSEVCTGELSVDSECGVDVEGSSAANNGNSNDVRDPAPTTSSDGTAESGSSATTQGAHIPVRTTVEEYSCCWDAPGNNGARCMVYEPKATTIATTSFSSH